jgi:hypothetical protein
MINKEINELRMKITLKRKWLRIWKT